MLEFTPSADAENSFSSPKRDLIDSWPGKTACTQTDLQLTCISNATDFLALEEEWNALFAHSAGAHHIFQSFSWLYHWHAVYLENESCGPAPKLAIITGRVKGKLVTVWPLVEQRSAGAHTVEWMGAPVSQYGDVIVARGPNQKKWLRDGLAYIKSHLQPDVMVFWNVRADSQIAQLLGGLPNWSLGREEAPYLDLSGLKSFKDFRAGYSKRTRKTRSRKRRRLLEQPNVQEKIYSESARAGEIAIDTVRIKRQWLEERNIVSRAFCNASFDRFMKRVVTTKTRTVNTVVTAILCDGKVIAGEIGFKNKGTYFSHVAAYDLDYARLSAGVLQFENTIDHCIKNEIRTIDLLAPCDPYKLEWATGTVRVETLALPCTLKGYLAAIVRADVTKNLIRSCLKLFPASWSAGLTHSLAKVCK